MTGFTIALFLFVLDYIRLLSIIFNEMVTKEYFSFLGIIAYNEVSENGIITTFSISPRTILFFFGVCSTSMIIGYILNKKNIVV